MGIKAPGVEVDRAHSRSHRQLGRHPQEELIPPVIFILIGLALESHSHGAHRSRETCLSATSEHVKELPLTVK
ncbi:hypothetical protein SKAU_G00306300 [Synaphobranchus kaupii]|uniref:Uncharacterized protein n=1 Tax=Synaphobranchus kaupii TaxID=118154 RepID=A0A9Q1IJV6_SYNKA|nr:hypothetical protein SKAU_G00306300 [Synaphobranchus kaupii]